MNCLNCFVLIYTSSDHLFRLPLFLLAATLNFTNFSFIVLWILAPHVKIVGYAARLGSQGTVAESLEFRAKLKFNTQAFLAIIIGMACGFCKFPTIFYMTLIAASFGNQVIRVGRLNERFFTDSFAAFTLCVAKLVYCVV